MAAVSDHNTSYYPVLHDTTNLTTCLFLPCFDDHILHLLLPLDATPISAAEALDDDHRFKGLMCWWLEKVFPAFLINPKKMKDRSVPKSSIAEIIKPHQAFSFLSEEAPLPHESFIRDLAENRGAGKRVDEYLSHHIGLSALSKLGGSSTQVARRLVSRMITLHFTSMFISASRNNIALFPTIHCRLWRHSSNTAVVYLSASLNMTHLLAAPRPCMTAHCNSSLTCGAALSGVLSTLFALKEALPMITSAAC